MTNDLVKIAKEFPKGFYTVTNKKGEKFTCKTRLDGGDLTELMREVFDKRIRQNLLELKIEIDHQPLEVGLERFFYIQLSELGYSIGKDTAMKRSISILEVSQIVTPSLGPAEKINEKKMKIQYFCSLGKD